METKTAASSSPSFGTDNNVSPNYQTLSLAEREKICAKYAKKYGTGEKLAKGKILDTVCSLTGWSRAHARRRLKTEFLFPRQTQKKRAARSYKYSKETHRVLERIWRKQNKTSGTYLAEHMAEIIAELESRGKLIIGEKSYSETVRSELLEISPATIDRYLKAKKSVAKKSSPKPKKAKKAKKDKKDKKSKKKHK